MKHFCALISLLLLLTLPCFAQDKLTWNRLPGPPGGSANSFALLTDQTLLAGSSRGLFASFDQGRSWIPRAENQVIEEVFSLLATDDGPIFAGTQSALYKSENNGLTWDIMDINVDNPMIYALVEGQHGDLYAGSLNHGVFRSPDGGITWTTVTTGLNDLRIRTLAFSKVGDLYAGTENGIFRLPNQMNSWETANDGLPQFMDRNVNTIVSYPSGKLLAGTSSGIFEADADLRVWQPLVRDLGNRSTAGGVIAVVQNNEGHLYAATRQGVFRSTNDGLTWDTLSDGLPAAFSESQAVQTLYLNGNGEVLAGTYAFGVFRLVTPQDLWTPSHAGYTNQTVSSLLTNRFGTIFASTPIGLFQSEDVGRTWQHTVVQNDVQGFNLIFKDDEDRLFAVDSSLLISIDDGDTWAPILSRTPTAFLALDDLTFIAGFASSEIYRSEDGAETWEKIGDIPSQAAFFQVVTLIYDERIGLMAGTSEGVFRSANLGETWELIPMETTFGIGHTLTTDSKGRLYAGGYQALYRSDENGLNWQRILTIESSVVDLLPASGERLYAFTSAEGVLESQDDGQSWESSNNGLSTLNITSVHREIPSPGVSNVYVGTLNNGLFYNAGQIQLPTSQEKSPQVHHSFYHFPNPVSESGVIRFSLLDPSPVRLEVYDVLGRRQATLLDRFLDFGSHQVTWSPSALSSGMYMIHLRTPTTSKVIQVAVQ